MDPSDELLEQVERRLRIVHAMLDYHLATGCRELPDYDLETGRAPACELTLQVA